MPDDAEVLELERRVFGSAGTVAAETDSAIAELFTAAGSKLAWVVGRRMRKLLVLLLVGEDIFPQSDLMMFEGEIGLFWRDCFVASSCGISGEEC